MTTTAEKQQLPDKGQCFRPRRHYLVVSVICAVFSLAMGITPAVLAWHHASPFPRPERAALFFGVFWSVWTLLAVWVIVAYFRERLFVTNKMIIHYGIIRSRTIHVDEVIHINWRYW